MKHFSVLTRNSIKSMLKILKTSIFFFKAIKTYTKKITTFSPYPYSKKRKGCCCQYLKIQLTECSVMHKTRIPTKYREKVIVFQELNISNVSIFLLTVNPIQTFQS